MQTKNHPPLPPDLPDNESLPYLQAYFELVHLKYLFRQGWLHAGIAPAYAESVAEHSYGVAVLSMWLAQAHFPELNLARVLSMALLHDFGEIYAGDLMPTDQVSAAEKQADERASVRQVLTKLPEGSHYLELWEEFEAGQTAEARFVRQIDRLEMAFQASVYAQQEGIDLDRFFQSATEALEDPLLFSLCASAQQVSHSKPTHNSGTPG